MSDKLKFGAFARLLYDLNAETCAMQKYDMDGCAYTGTQIVKPGAVPALLFQMVDAGYLVKKEKQQGSVVTVIAVSHEWMETERARRGE